MNNNIKLSEIAIYHPENIVKNDFYIEHFEKQGRDISHLLSSLGREERYIIDNDEENGITMAIEASKRVLEKAGLKGEDLDVIIFTTHAPEYTFPTNAMFVHDAIEAKSNTIIFDMNANCAGMTIAVETASRYMLANKRVNRALIIGSDANSLITNPEQEITYANFADGAAAIILEKTNEETGFIDAVYEVDSTNKNNMLYPPAGFSKTNGQKTSIDFLPFDGAMAIPAACKMIENLLADNEMTIDDVDAFCLSQFALSNILKIQNHFNIPDKKIINAGKEFGYTTTSSPFFCLHKGIENGQIKRGDTILFWTIAAGHEMVAMLFKY